MSLTVHSDLLQGSDEWLEARRGLVTASVVGKLITVGPPAAVSVDCPTCGTVANTPCISTARKVRTEIKTVHEARTVAASERPPTYGVADNDTSRGVTAALVAERITGRIEETPMTSDMWRGIEHEPFARDAYSKHHAPVTEVGFMVRDDWGFSIGYSPDGLVGDDGLLEIKSPRAKTHLTTVLAGEVPAHYMAQLQAGLLVSGRKWIDFIPFVAGLPLWSKRITPDPAWHRAIVAAVATFETTAAEMVAAYTQATEGFPATERIEMEIVI